MRWWNRKLNRTEKRFLKMLKQCGRVDATTQAPPGPFHPIRFRGGEIEFSGRDAFINGKMVVNDYMTIALMRLSTELYCNDREYWAYRRTMPEADDLLEKLLDVAEKS